MALDRDQVGLLFKVNADTADAVQAFSLLRGVVEGMAAETSEQLQRMASRFGAVGDQVRKTGQQFRESFGDAARGQLAGYVSQFGLFGDAAAGMIPSLTGSAAAIAGIGGAAVATTAAMGALMQRTMDFTGRVDDLRQITGLTNETIQSLQLGAQLAGQSFEAVSQTAVIFQRRLQEAQEGNKDLADTFRTLGIDLQGDVDTAFRQTLERLNGMSDGAQKTAVAIDLFGRSGAALLPVINQVGGSFDGLVQRAKELGIVLSEQDIKAANDFQDSIDILTLKIEGLGRRIATSLLPRLQQIATAFIGGAGILPLLAELRRQEEEQLGQMGTLDEVTRARLEGVDTGATGQTALDRAMAALAQQRRAAAAKAAGAGAAQLVNLPSGDAVKRIYDSYIASILTEERRVSAERERLRIAALDGEEARLIDQARRLEEQITQARLQALQMGNDLIQGRLIQGRLDVLQAEATATQGKLDEIRAKRDVDLEAQYAKEVDDYRRKEEAKRQEEQRSYENSIRLNQALQAMFEEGRRQRTESLAADPSSPLSIFGAQGQEAADKGAGIFGQISASATEAISSVSDQLGNFSSMMTDALNAVAGGLQNIIANFIITGRIGGAAFKALAAQIISAVTAQAAVKAIFELAEGFAASARYDFAAAAQHFTAAKFYGVVAGVAAAASVGLAAIGGGGGGDNGTMFLGQDRRSGSAVMEQGGRRATEPQVIIIRAETEPGVMVSKFVQDYRANGEARSVLRRDLLGEF